MGYLSIFRNDIAVGIIYTDEDLNPHNHRRWLHVLIHLSATFPLNDINSPPKAGGFKSSKV